MNIQTMSLDQYPQVLALWQECHLSEEPEDSREEVESLLHSSQGTGFVAETNGTVVGAVLCGNDGRYGYIHHLAVSTNMRRQGLGKRLVSKCIQFVQCRNIIILVRSDNAAAQAFWNHLQFRNADWVQARFLSIK